MKKGRYYEQKTADVVQKFNPSAQVMQGIRVQGKLSKISREVDVELTDPSRYDHIIFECKDHKAKVDIELVEALVTKLQDLGAKKGAIVSNSGFTKGAFNIANAHGIDLLSIVDTDDDKIRTKVFAPNIIEDSYIDSGFCHLDNIQGDFRLNPNINDIQIKTAAGVLTWPQVLANHWNDKEMRDEPKLGERHLKLDNATIIDARGSEITVGQIDITYYVKRRYLFRNMELLDTQGIYNVAQQTYQTNSIKSEVIRAQDLSNPDIWKPINEDEAKAMVVPFRMTIATPLPTKNELA